MNGPTHPGNTSDKLRVINIGLEVFYESLVKQNAKATQISYTPPAPKNEEMQNLLSQLL